MISENGVPAKVVSLVFKNIITPCYDERIMKEYESVLARPKFNFDPLRVRQLIKHISTNGKQVIPINLDIVFTDKDDKKFYEVAKSCKAEIITENTKHFPPDEIVLTAAEFLEKYNF